MGLKCCMVEACPDADAGSIGPFYVAHHARLAGHTVDVLRSTRRGYDVELISVHHCDNFPNLAALPKRAKWRIVGGHVMQNNPRPAIPYADVVCIGEAETWIKKALTRLEDTGDLESLASLPGTILSAHWVPGSPIPTPNFETPLPDNPPYLNRPGTRSAAWYVEIARGCPFSCFYCELGHSSPARIYRKEHLISVLERCDLKLTKKINFYAPDEASHPDYLPLYEWLFGKGYLAGFASMRVDTVMRRRPPIRANQLIRVGIDGLTDATRARVNKPISEDQIVEYFQTFLEAGHIAFKMFQIIGYPWETPEDFDEFEGMMDRIFRLPMRKNVSLRVKWTPFIPQPQTPLRDAVAVYDYAMVDRIQVWHALKGRPRNEPGFYVENDGLMSSRSHRRQCQLTHGHENILAQMRLGRLPPLHPSACTGDFSEHPLPLVRGC